MKNFRLILPVLVLAGMTLSGCIFSQGQVSHTTSLSDLSELAAPVSLCAAKGNVDSLVVKRIPAFATGFLFPDVLTSKKAGRFTEVARTLCALPRLHIKPGSFTSCPAAMGVDYELLFATPRESVTPVRISSGCEFVSGIGGYRWLLSSPGFWPLLGAAMGLPPSDQDWSGGPIRSLDTST